MPRQVAQTFPPALNVPSTVARSSVRSTTCAEREIRPLVEAGRSNLMAYSELTVHGTRSALARFIKAKAAVQLQWQSHGDFVSTEQSRAEMVPGKIFNYAPPGRAAHLFNHFRMSIKIFECGRDGIDVSRPDNDSFHLVAHNISRLARRDLRQTAGRSFICDFGAALPLRRKNVHCALVEIILRITHKPERADAVAPEFFEIRPRLLVDRA